jgi:D-3-phosphoglycerate dehydrogenase
VPRCTGRTLGIVGFGRIGRAVARKASGFGWRLLAHDPFTEQAIIHEHGAEPTDLTTVLRESDFVTLHVPVTEATYHLIGARELDCMRPSAYLINTSRGRVVDTRALHRALNSGRIAGAALDVLEQEPPAADEPLLTCPRALITSHVAWYSAEAVTDLRVKSAREVGRVTAGEAPLNLVNPLVRSRAAGHVA